MLIYFTIDFIFNLNLKINSVGLVGGAGGGLRPIFLLYDPSFWPTGSVFYQF
jgi:hypothetical protein